MNSKAEKFEWIINYLKEHGSDNILNVEFCEKYAAEFYPPEKDVLGEKDLARQLGSMYKEGLVKRTVYGLSNKQNGSPNWYYEYELQ